MAKVPVEVLCYSGHTYAQKPRVFILHGQRHRVACVERTWRTPDGPQFLVRVRDDERFVLAYKEAQDRWYLSWHVGADE